MKISLVPQENLATVWPHVFGFIHQAVFNSGQRDSIDVLAEELFDGKITLWVAFDDKIYGAAIVRMIKDVNQNLILRIDYVGGSKGLTWIKPMLQMLENYAKDQMCDTIETWGLPKWEAMSKRCGMTEVLRVYRKDVTPFRDYEDMEQ